MLTMVMLLFLLLLPVSVNAQTPPDTTQYVTIPRSEFDKTMASIRVLLDQEATKTQTIVTMNREIELLKFMMGLDSLTIQSKNAQIESLKEEVNLVNEKLMDRLDIKFWDRKEFYYVLGVLTVVLAQQGTK